MFSAKINCIIYFLLLIQCHKIGSYDPDVNIRNTKVWGPGLRPHELVLPVRYFYIEFKDKSDVRTEFSKSLSEDLNVSVSCADKPIWVQTLDRQDATFIVRYKTYQTCNYNFRIVITFRGKHLGGSPYVFKAPVESDSCQCIKSEPTDWLKTADCSNLNQLIQLKNDLHNFPTVDFKAALDAAIAKFHNPGSHSFCHYAVKNNKIFRKCYGEHVGFHIFPDAILLSLNRKMKLPDVEFLMNLGDWPLVSKQSKGFKIPMFSWCGSNQTYDIVLPTYEITEAALEGMRRVSLDMMTVQSNSELTWENKIPKMFWRGRDSRQERLDLVLIARKYPDLINASLTNFFFFRDKKEIYGPTEPHVSFFSFFNYKYQLNIDGTVAAYRFPFLLAGDSVVFKTESEYYEHFYQDIQPWVHYIPVKSTLEDLIEKIKWARENDEEVKKIGENGRRYAQEHLMPVNIFCYHAVLLLEWSKRLKDPVIIKDDMELVTEPKTSELSHCKPCAKHNQNKEKLEL